MRERFGNVMDQAVKERIEKLRKKINQYANQYYNEDNPSVSDYDYDLLMNELKQLEASHPELVTPDSPTQRVGGEASNLFEKVTH